MARRDAPRPRPAAAAGGIDYYPLWLLQTRLRLAARVARGYEGGEAPPGEVAEMAAWLLPWEPDDAARCFRPGAPSLGDAWQALAVRLDGAAAGLTGRAVCDTLNRAVGCDPPVSLAQWNQWMRRVRDEARGRFPPADWEALFLPWL